MNKYDIKTKRGGTGTSYPPVGAGMHAAICYGIIGIGRHLNPFNGRYSPKVIFLWELVDELIEYEGEMKPRVISEQYTNSLGELANMTAMLESWRGKAFSAEELDDFNLSNVLGVACVLTTIIETSKKGREFAKITAISKLTPPFKVPEKPTNDFVQFDISCDDVDLRDMEVLPEWIQNRIKESEEYKAIADSVAGSNELSDSDDFAVVVNDDDLPF